MKGKSARHTIGYILIAVFIALAIFSIAHDTKASEAHEPWCGLSFIDGQDTDWAEYSRETFFATLYQGQNNNIWGQSYMMYWTEDGVDGYVSVMVKLEPGYELHIKDEEQWVKAWRPGIDWYIAVDDTMLERQPDGAQFAYIGNDSWEATFPWPNHAQGAVDIHVLVKTDETIKLIDTLTIKPSCVVTAVELKSFEAKPYGLFSYIKEWLGW